MGLLETTLEQIQSLDTNAMRKARERLDSLLKPPGSLGRLEEIAIKLAGITGAVGGPVGRKTILVMAGDNGITEEKVSSFPREISTLVAETMLKGISGVSVLARHAGADIKLVDLGLQGDVRDGRVIDRKIRRMTSNMACGPAMTRDEALRAVETGIEITNLAVEEGAGILGTGEIGIGNTTTASAVLHAFGAGELDEIVGRGAGLSDEGLRHKKEVIRRAVELNRPDPADPVDVLSKVGGFDIAGLCGCYLAAAALRRPIVIDGFIAGTAAVAAVKMHPGARDFMFTSHASAEPGVAAISRVLELSPMLALDMRLGEGTGAALAFHVIEAALKIVNEMGTFKDIGM
ncbi:MAG TPA: nicotinate-nucleotide--dimethylbenzimidazole phosphoribosyltransferase [Spirochaetota bacterium]|nr:nicotinate-nucleotide--dimethylbenzimidazole phosphoribosyltransferase [Spirochaetota bacterium]HPV42832.1 nicotinate-nucleotide--dimethylbenzimidazole phosphoribosyltransferase [Spirochaetota bacterium]